MVSPTEPDILVRADALSKIYPIHQSAVHVLKNRVAGALQLRPKAKAIHQHEALQGVSFELRRGQSLGVIGKNGSGKSTLLQLIAGTLRPTSGSLVCRGRIAAILELGAGFHPDFSGRENVLLQLAIHGVAPESARDRMPKIEAFAEIGKFFDEPTKTYSSGMLVRLAFATIAHLDPDILIVDEALAVGDAYFVQKCLRFIEDFRPRGILLLVSHSTSAIRTHCDDALWIDSARVRMHGTSNRVTEAYIEAFFAENNERVAQDLSQAESLLQGAGAMTERPQSSPETRAQMEDPSQTGGKTVKLPTTAIAARIPAFRDPRLDYVQNSTLRNDLEIIQFDRSTAQSFGKKGAEISSVLLKDTTGNSLSWCIGGEAVELEVGVICHARLQSPIVGFFVRNSVGLEIFGDNTFLTSQIEGVASYPEGASLVARFRFFMPILPEGDYTVTVSIAEGNETTHIQHEWIHDALAFRSLSTSVCTCLVGIPMQAISLEQDA